MLYADSMLKTLCWSYALDHMHCIALNALHWIQCTEWLTLWASQDSGVSRNGTEERAVQAGTVRRMNGGSWLNLSLPVFVFASRCGDWSDAAA